MAQWLSENMQSIQKKYHALVVGPSILPTESFIYQNLEKPLEFSLSNQDLSSKYDMKSRYKVL